MKDLIIVFSPQSNAAKFVLSGLDIKNVTIVPLCKRKNIIYKIIARILFKLKLNKYAAYLKYESNVRRQLADAQKRILFFDCLQFYEYEIINAIIKSSDKHIFFWNPISIWSNNKERLRNYIIKFRNLGFKLATFDFKDADTYKMELKKNVNRRFLIKENAKEMNDFYFLGKPKGREAQVRAIESKLKEYGFSTNFKLVKAACDYVTLDENILLSAKSRCIVDLTSPNQTGFTLRPFDALFLHKKLLTTNKAILKTDFYRPENVFYFDGNNMHDIIKFMSEEMVDIPDNIVSQYEVNQWVKDNYLND